MSRRNSALLLRRPEPAANRVPDADCSRLPVTLAQVVDDARMREMALST